MSVTSDVFRLACAQLRRDENEVLHAYRDSKGYLTIGVGRLIDPARGGGITAAESQTLLTGDVMACVADLAGLPAWQGVKDDPLRSASLINMRFQLGAKGFREFTHALDRIAARDWAGAATALTASKWARQDTPARARRVIDGIVKGSAK